VGQAGGHMGRSYDVLFTEFLPALRARGLGKEDIETLMVRNPARALAATVRMAR
jgi:predicted metal-dependent phosphotriesterase family hydrolase